MPLQCGFKKGLSSWKNITSCTGRRRRSGTSCAGDAAEKCHALSVMIRQLEREPNKVAAEQVTDVAVTKLCIGRIDIEFMSGKRSEKTVLSE